MALPIERLDRSRPFGEVYGDADHNVKFTQKSLGIESWPYDAHGELIEAALDKKQRDKLAERRAAFKPVPIEETIEDTVEELHEEDLAAAAAAAAARSAEFDEINFEMWLRGEVKYRPNDLQKAAQQRYGVNKPQMRELARYLVEEQKLVPRKLVHKSVLS